MIGVLGYEEEKKNVYLSKNIKKFNFLKTILVLIRLY